MLAVATSALGQAASAAIPTVKALTGWSPAAVGIWSLLIVQLVFLASIVARTGPNWIKALSESWKQKAETQAAVEAAAQAHQVTLDVAAEARLKKIEDGLKRSENVTMYLVGAVTLSLNALRAVDANNPAIVQANTLVEMAVAAGGDGVWAKSLARLANIPGVGE